MLISQRLAGVAFELAERWLAGNGEREMCLKLGYIFVFGTSTGVAKWREGFRVCFA